METFDFSLINDHLHECEDCGNPCTHCECHRNDGALDIAQRFYEDARVHWNASIAEYNKLPFWKKLFTRKPQEPSIVDFI